MSRTELLISHGVLIFLIIILAWHGGEHLIPAAQASRDASGTYKFTSPLLDYEDAQMAHVSLFSEGVEGEVSGLQKKYSLDFAAVYFRDLDNGQWIAVNEKAPLASASLVKLPILMSVLKAAEKDPAALGRTIEIEPADVRSDLTQDIAPEVPLVPGQKLTLQALTERMITESDNVATQAILRAYPVDKTEVFKSVGVKFTDEDGELMVSVKNYAGFFRVLFNATYLSRDDSEKALAMLSRVKFTQGLVAGVPASVPVAHKFGERTVTVNGLSGLSQLHDCGIIYYPKNPYILCVMTRGQSLESEEKFIAEVSNYFYRQVEESLSSTGEVRF